MSERVPAVLFSVIVGLVLLSLLLLFWFVTLMVVGAWIILYAHYLASSWGRKRYRWRLRFGLFGSFIYALGPALFWMARQRVAEPQFDSIMNPLFLAEIFVGIHLVGFVGVKMLDVLYNFFHEDDEEPFGVIIERSRQDGRAEQERARQAREREEAARQERAQARQQEEEEHEGFTGSVQTEKQALEIFELSKPFTREELKKRRMDLLKKVHPDQGGSNMMARLVNEAYELLLRQL